MKHIHSISRGALFIATIATLASTAIMASGCKTANVNLGRAASLREPLTIQTHTAGEAGFLVNSHLIMGAREAILVDAQFTRDEARKVAAMVKKSGHKLTQILITHGHPDHYLGLDILTHEFPKAQVLSTQAVIDDIRKTGPGKLAYWKPIYKENFADRFILPQPLKTQDGKATLDLEGEKLEIAEMGEGESEHSIIIYLPAIKTLVAGDLAYNQVHLWLAENHPEGWRRNLKTARALGAIERVLPGHGAATSVHIMDENDHYIDRFVQDTAKPATAEQAKARIKADFPNYALPVIADLSVAARIK